MTAGIFWESNQYKMYTGGYSWTAAEEMCQLVGGHLASIASLEENEVILNITGGWSAWIGGSDTVRESFFVWSDGAPWNFHNFRDSRIITQTSPSENCVYIFSTGRWNDLSCSSTMSAVCKGKY